MSMGSVLRHMAMGSVTGASVAVSNVLRYRLRSVFLGPLVVGAIIAILLMFVPQSREVYLATIENWHIVHGLVGFALIALLCFQLDCWHHMLGLAAINRTYPEHADLDIDRIMLWWNSSASRLAALLPMVGFAAGVGLAVFDKVWAEAVLGEKVSVPEFETAYLGFTPSPTWLIKVNAWMLMAATTVGVLIVAALLYKLVFFVIRKVGDSSRLRRLVRRRTAQILFIFSLAFAILPIVPYFHPYWVPLAQAIGPIGSAAIVMITAVSILAALSYFSAILRFPIVGAFMFGVLVLLVWQMVSVLSPPPILEDDVPPVSDTPDRRKGVEQLRADFENWLASRADKKAFADAGKDYPVFIVAAQGGGIYAAATTLAFMSAVQDECPAFAQHVFVISGVSGGAVGSAIFNSLSRRTEAEPSPDCIEKIAALGDGSQGPLTEEAAAIVAQDHLSPALLQIWPDFIRKTILPLFDLSSGFDRSTALEASVACAFTKEGRAGWTCPGAGSENNPLLAPFEDHWRAEGKAPGLVLSATWGETGYRAAFSPFPLWDLSDGTNYALPSGTHTGDYPGQSFVLADDGQKPISLAEAAFVSARFPGIVPAYSVTFKHKERSTTERLWNFVDGGYVDNSGATTALEFYQQLEKLRPTINTTKTGIRPDLYLLLLTDVSTDPNLAEVETGTELSDTVAPVMALLNVRAQLSNRAVKRVKETVAAEATNTDLSGRGLVRRKQSLMVVNLKQRVYSFPLGWRISPITHKVVKQLLGRSDQCEEAEIEWKPVVVAKGRRSLAGRLIAARPPTSLEIVTAEWKRVRNFNSCVKKSIREILTIGRS
ncbi:MAG: hypothetical protein NW216_11495 [Hyphomicrobium sp.]|nr:hypothetical protein [Hyphomicrobium sp.]